MSRHLTLTAPDELPAWLTPPSVNESVNEWVNEWVNVGQYIKCFEWPLVRKVQYKCSLFTIDERID